MIGDEIQSTIRRHGCLFYSDFIFSREVLLACDVFPFLQRVRNAWQCLLGVRKSGEIKCFPAQNLEAPVDLFQIVTYLAANPFDVIALINT